MTVFVLMSCTGFKQLEQLVGQNWTVTVTEHDNVRNHVQQSESIWMKTHQRHQILLPHYL